MLFLSVNLRQGSRLSVGISRSGGDYFAARNVIQNACWGMRFVAKKQTTRTDPTPQVKVAKYDEQPEQPRPETRLVNTLTLVNTHPCRFDQENYDWLPKQSTFPLYLFHAAFQQPTLEKSTPVSLGPKSGCGSTFPLYPGPSVSTSGFRRLAWSEGAGCLGRKVHFAAEPSRFWGICNDKRVSSENPMQGDINASSLANLWKSVS